MKKALFIVLAALTLTACAGYFNDYMNDNGAGGLNPLALVGGGTLSDDNANDQSPFLFRSGGKAYLFFSSDRSGSLNIYYAEMDATEKFLGVVKMDTNINAPGFAEESPVVFTMGGSNFITFSRKSTVNSNITYYLDSSLKPVAMTGLFMSGTNTMNGFLSDPTNPLLLVCDGTGVVKQLSFNSANASNWIFNSSFDTGTPVNAGYGYAKNAVNFYIFSAVQTVYGTRQIIGGTATQIASFTKLAAYSSSYNDFTPVVDAQTGKVYFASDRYGRGNMDLYRYNTLTYDAVIALPATMAPGVFVTTSGNDANNGLTALTPVKTLQIGVMKAVSNFFTNVYVQQGTYYMGNGLNASSNSGVQISNNGINLSGGWNSGFTAQSGYSVLDGTNRVNHLILVNNVSNVVVNGFIVQNGAATLTTPVPNEGGGVFLYSAFNCLVFNTIICSNFANTGGGICLDTGSGNTISAIVTSNYSANSGGGMYIYFATNNSFSGVFSSNIGNSAGLGSGGGGIGIFNSVSNFIIDAEISWNKCTFGGGIYNGDSFDFIWKCSIINNQISSLGTAIFLGSLNSGISILSNIITNSLATNLIYIYQAGTSPYLMFIYNLFGCSLNTGTAIYEGAAITGHTLFGNRFATNQLQALYHDTVNGDITNANWININNPIPTGAGATLGNTAVMY